MCASQTLWVAPGTRLKIWGAGRVNFYALKCEFGASIDLFFLRFLL